MSADKVTLRAAIGNYAHTEALKKGDVKSDRLALDFVEVNPIHRAFTQMVREAKFDVSEMAIVTFLQAKAYGKPLVLVPTTMLGRFQHGCMLYNADRGKLAPADLPGRRVGVRAYTQTTGAWLRGILGNDYGVDLGKVQWVTQEDAHVPEYREPPGIERADAGKDLTEMLLDGEVDAAVFGGAMPTDPRLQSVIPDPDTEAQAWHRKYGVVPVNHLIVVSKDVADTKPDAVREMFSLLVESKRAAGLPKPGRPDTFPMGVDGVRPALELMINYAEQQKLTPRRLTVDELFDDNTRTLKG